MWRFCESVVIHFLMGHEFGHYAYRARSAAERTRFTKDAAVFIGLESLDEAPAEEIHADVWAIDNCLFQHRRFQIPREVLIYGLIWLNALWAALLERGGRASGCDTFLEQVQHRREALRRLLLSCGSGARSVQTAVSTTIETALETLPPVASHVAGRLV
jgi:hypothetical protein